MSIIGTHANSQTTRMEGGRYDSRFESRLDSNTRKETVMQRVTYIETRGAVKDTEAVYEPLSSPGNFQMSHSLSQMDKNYVD